MSDAPIVAFLTGDGVDNAGRRFAEVIAMDDNALECHHDFIQWLFPLNEPSRAVPGSPVLDEAAIAIIASSAFARTRLDAAAARMLAFYANTRVWRQRYDHNHLRITRIIRSLRLLVDDAAADGFRRDVLRLAGDAPIDARAREFWARA